MLLFAVGWQLLEAVWSPHRYVSGYEVAARTVYELPNNGTILFAGKHDGNFIFHLRRLDQKRQRVVLRGDKTLVSMSVHKYFGLKSHVNDVTSVQSMLNEYGVRWIVVESKDLVGLNEFKLLHEALRRPRYRLAARIQVSSNVTGFKDVEILIYENTGLNLPQNGLIRIN